MAHLLQNFLVLKAEAREYLLGTLDSSTSSVPEKLVVFEKQLGETKGHVSARHHEGLAKVETDTLEFHELYEEASDIKGEERVLFLETLKPLGEELE
ncbi:MAG: hypothetical protein ABJ360_23365, partial [Roseobacter sp.]